jgi:mono/diheme cytochrome c family protein
VITLITRAPLLILVLLLSACAIDRFAPPPVTQALVARASPDHATAPQLKTGRKIFASRCIDCHTLPVVSRYSRDQWPRLVSRMASRADLTADEEQSVIAYLRAAANP